MDGKLCRTYFRVFSWCLIIAFLKVLNFCIILFKISRMDGSSCASSIPSFFASFIYYLLYLPHKMAVPSCFLGKEQYMMTSFMEGEMFSSFELAAQSVGEPDRMSRKECDLSMLEGKIKPALQLSLCLNLKIKMSTVGLASLPLQLFSGNSNNN